MLTYEGEKLYIGSKVILKGVKGIEVEVENIQFVCGVLCVTYKHMGKEINLNYNGLKHLFNEIEILDNFVLAKLKKWMKWLVKIN